MALDEAMRYAGTFQSPTGIRAAVVPVGVQVSLSLPGKAKSSQEWHTSSLDEAVSSVYAQKKTTRGAAAGGSTAADTAAVAATPERSPAYRGAA